MGRVDHALDEKGRLVVPSRFRAGLGERFTVTIVPSDFCVALFSHDEWLRFCERLESVPRDAEKRKFERFLSEHTTEGASCDAQGRLLLSQQQRAFAGIDKDIVTVSTRERVEIWAKERYTAALPSREQAAAYSEAQRLF